MSLENYLSANAIQARQDVNAELDFAHSASGIAWGEPDRKFLAQNGAKEMHAQDLPSLSITGGSAATLYESMNKFAYSTDNAEPSHQDPQGVSNLISCLRDAYLQGYDGKTGVEAVKALANEVNKLFPHKKRHISITPQRHHSNVFDWELRYPDGCMWYTQSVES
jgi:hypothetical protein